MLLSSNHQCKYVLGLLDTGASGVYIKREALKNINHTLESTPIRLQGCYKTTHCTQVATFTIKLPDFTSARELNVTAYVEDMAQGRHDIVLGRSVCKQLGLKFDFKQETVTWDDITIPMKQKGTLSRQINFVDNQDAELPTFMQKATKRLERISANAYDKHNYKEMVLRCNHLSTQEQEKLLTLFSSYDELFSGALGEIPNVRVHLQLKPNPKPYFAKAYSIPQSIYDIAKQEVEELVRLGVLIKN